MPKALPSLIFKMPRTDSDKSHMKQQEAFWRQMNNNGKVLAHCLRARKSPMGAPRCLKRPSQPQTNFGPLKRLLRTSQAPLTKSLTLLLVLVASLACVAIAKPNSNQNKNQQNQIQLTDKQLIRKAHDSSESLSRDSGGAANRGTGSSNPNPNASAGPSSSGQQEQSSSLSSVFSCPEQFGYYTDTKDCTKYYVCVFGEVLHESCTGGLRFSRELQTCDWPRNVECPAGQPVASPPDASGSTTASSLASSGPSTAAAAAAAASSASSSSSTQATTMSSFASTGPSTTPASITTTTVASSTTSQQSNQVDSGARMKGASNSMAFADEASDPQQPSFDEAISPVITADGAIHLHDGSGGTFGLAPNHNRALQSPQSLNGPVEAGGLSGGASSSSGRNMDVFVMPLAMSNQAGRNQQQQTSPLRPSASNNKRQQQQQQFSPTANSGQNQTRQQQLVRNMNQNQASQEFNGDSGNQNGANANKVLMPATLPPRARQQQSQFENGNSNDLTSRQTPSDNREDSGNNFSESTISEESGDFNLGSPNREGSANLDSEGNPNDGSLAAQADQDSLNNGDENDASSSNGDSMDSNNSGAGSDSENVAERSLAYVPPVLTSSTFTPPNLQNSNNQPPNRQKQASSPLLSINNRQIVDPTRQTFKPVIAPSQAQQLQNGQLISSSRPPAGNQQQQPPPLRPQQPNINLNANNVNLNTNRQMGLQQQEQQQQQQNNRQSRMSSAFRSQAQNLAQAPTQQTRPRPLLLTNTFQAPSNQSARFFLAQNNQQLVASNVNSFASDPQQQQQPRVSRLQASPAPPSRNTQNLPRATFAPRFPAAINSNNLQQQSNQLTSSLQRSQNSPFPTPRAFNTFTGQPGAAQPFGDLPPSNAVNFSNSSPLDQFSASADQFIRNNEPALQSVAPRRPRPPKRNQIPNQSRRQPNALLDFDPTTTTSTTLSTPIQRFQTTSNGFNTAPSSLQDNADGSQDPTDDQRSSFTTPESFPQDQSGSVFETPLPPSTRQQQPLRPLVGSTSNANFRDSSATLPTQQPPPASSTSGNSLVRSQRPPTQSNQQQFHSSTHSSQQQTTTLASSPPADDQGATNPQTTADPQSVANRYLNSAIDALEAGQPFGTVDYDFDILNDNQTDRRQTSSGNGAPDSLPPGNLTSSSRPGDRAQTITRQRLQQQAAAAAVAAAASQDQADGQEQRGGGRARSSQSASSPAANNQQQSTAATKKPRPTNKKIVVNHEQALLNNRASTEPARRPEPIFSTPQPLQAASKCDNRVCRLPDCKCGDTLNPAGLEAKTIPQIVLLTFDDAVNDLNWEIYEELFSGRTNPNGCPVLATFYVSHEWTDYGQVQTLYSRGHEMASHSVTHSFGEKFSKNQWFKEINGQREILNMYGGVKMNDVRGMRAPFLQIGGNKMFEMLYDANFTYDSSMPIFENSPPLWPYTLDYQLAHECMITPCPTKSFPGVWEVGMTMWVDLRGGRCSMGDACSNPTDEDGVYEMLMKNFNRHYKSNRAPFGLFYHSAWFNTVHHRRGFLRFMSTVNALPEVFFVTNWQMLQWMRQPTPLSEINSFEPWQCPAKNDRPPPCHHPAVCNVKSEHGTRFMKTCQPCPANQQYPWVGSTGFNKSKQSGSG